jgi:class 3 adenylate cyclase
VALTTEHIRGMAVHAAARIVDEARQGEVLVSGTTRDLAEGAAGLAFERRGRYRLKGLEREHATCSPPDHPRARCPMFEVPCGQQSGSKRLQGLRAIMRVGP